MRIISWNVNGLVSTLRGGRMAAIAERRPSIVCIQESRTDDRPVVIDGFRHYYNPSERPGYAGTVVALRHEPRSVSFEVAGYPDAEGRVITVELKDAFVVNAYVPRSDGGARMRARRSAWNDRFAEHVAALAGEKSVIVCGDMNAVMDPDVDIYEGNPRRTEGGGWTSDERDLLVSLAELGLVDVFRHFNPLEGDAFTWWSQRRGRRAVNHGWRLDYFLATPDLLPGVRGVRHLTDIQGSDHCPIELDVRVDRRRRSG